MVGELGELLQELEERVPDKAKIAKEAGDLCWYIAETATVVGVELRDINRTTSDSEIRDLTLQICEIVEYVKKSWRHKSRPVAGQLQTDLQLALSFLTQILYYSELTLDVVLEQNLEKLRSRKDRGVIHGSGSER